MADSSGRTEEEPLFRSAKRRKIFRKRPEEEEDLAASPAITNNGADIQPYPVSPRAEPASTLPAQDVNEDDSEHRNTTVSVAEILRRRKAANSRRAGIEFSNIQRSTPTTSPPPSEALVPVTNAPSAVEAAVGRFAPQTGKVKDELDKHMMAYIDAEMAKLHNQATPSWSAYSSAHLTPSHHLLLQQQEAARKAAAEGLLQKQPATLGKLHEIDLGPDATLRNIARTEAATRNLEGVEDLTEVQEQGVGKVRLGQDGRPWRGGKKRDSEDIKRDKLVEEVLKESRLDLYDEPNTGPNINEDQAADERLAEEFRREFMDAVTSRNIRKAPAPPGGPSKGGKNEAPKGPKLGGSRSARAAMRALEEKAAKKR